MKLRSINTTSAGRVVVLIALLMFPGCGPDPGAGVAEGRPRVVASFFPVYDLARRIGGNDVEVRCLVPPGVDPHGAEGTPTAAKLVADADLVVLLGLGMDGWVEKLARSESGARTVVVTDGLQIRREAESSVRGGGESGAGAGSGSGSDTADTQGVGHNAGEGGVDPHVWLDPVHAAAMARRLGAEMERAFPASREALARRTTELVSELEALHAEFGEGLAAPRRREVVTFHGAFGHLFDRYGLRVAAVIEPFPGDEPSAGYLRELVELTRRLGIRVIMAEPQLPDGPARTIAREIGGEVERLDPCETVLVDDPDASYVDRQRRNLAVLRRVLGVDATRSGERGDTSEAAAP